VKYRQWKKNYKKKHGVNPPLELDKRKQRRLARKMARQINKTLPTAAETLTTAITRFTLAVDDGKDTDFINIKCFGRTAEWAQKWLSKGSRAEVTGKIKTGSYESQRTGSKVYYTEVVANSVGFGESKAEAEARGQQLPESDGFMNIPEGADEELPFN
jgi:single-strand DNA-binding protein